MATLSNIDILLAFHVFVSLVAVVAGIVAMTYLAAGRWSRGWQIAFLATTAATSLTGFLFPFGGVTPAFVFGVVSMLALAAAALAWNRRGRSRIVYAAAAAFALYLDLFVLVFQGFQKVAVLNRIAPTQSEPGFIGAQVAVLVFAVAVGILSARAGRPVGPIGPLSAPPT